MGQLRSSGMLTDTIVLLRSVRRTTAVFEQKPPQKKKKKLKAIEVLNHLSWSARLWRLFSGDRRGSKP